MAKRTLARKIMLSILTGAVLLGNSVAWANCGLEGCTICSNAVVGEKQVQIGSGLSADSSYGIAIGGNLVDTYGSVYPTTAAHSSIAIGFAAVASNGNSVVVGTSSSAGETAVALGYSSHADGQNSVAVGWGASAYTLNSVALGRLAKVNYDAGTSIALGAYACVNEDDLELNESNGVISVGKTTDDEMGDAFQRRIINVADAVNAYDAVNLQTLTAELAKVGVGYTKEEVDELPSNKYIAINTDQFNTSDKEEQAIAYGHNSIAIGDGASAGYSGSNYAIAIGGDASAGYGGVALGQGTIAGDADNSGAIALGYQAKATKYEAIAIGDNATATANASIAIGERSKTTNTGAIAIGDDAKSEWYGSVALGKGSYVGSGDYDYSTEATYGVISVGKSGTDGFQRRIINVADGKNDYDAANVKQLKNIALTDNKNNTYTFKDYAGNETTLSFTDNTDAVKTVVGISDLTADAVTSAYSSTTYLSSAGSLTGADIALDTAIKNNADAIATNASSISNETTARQNADITGASISGNTITLTRVSGDLTIAGIATVDDINTLSGNINTATNSSLTGASYNAADGKLTFTKGNAESIVVEDIASKSAVSNLESTLTTSLQKIKTDIGYSAGEETVLAYTDTKHLGEAKTLTAADKALDAAIGSVESSISTIENTITTIDNSINTINNSINNINGAISLIGLSEGIESDSIVAAINSVYEEAKKHTSVSAGNGITVTPSNNEGASGDTTGTATTNNNTNANGGTNYTVSENVTYVGDDKNITVNKTTDDGTKVSVSLNNDIIVDNVTATTVNSTTLNTENANITNQITVGTGDSQTTINGGDVTTNNFNSTNANITNVTTNNFQVKDSDTGDVTTTINQNGMTTNNVTTDNATVNNTFTVVNQEGNKTIIEGDKISVTNSENKTTVIEGDSITTNEIKLGDTTTNNYVTVNKDGMTIVNNNTQVIINENGIGFGGEDGDGNATGPVIGADGLDMNDNKVTNVADGEIAEGSKDAVNGGQVYEMQQNMQTIAGATGELGQRINKLGTRLNKVGAGAAALAALHPLDFDPDDKLSFSAGVGNYAGENAAALGMFYRPNEKVMLSMGGTMGNGEDMVNMGISFALDKPNNVSNSRVAMAKEINALREHVAKQDAQIAQLVMLVNQLTGNVGEQQAQPALAKDGRVRVERHTDGYEEYDRVKVVNHKEYGEKVNKK